MCGLAGWFIPAERSPGSEAMQAMTDAILHRGPDGEGQMLVTSRDGTWQAGLGHRRLSIIDLATGDQPMHYIGPDGRKLSIVFNGEVYNFQSLRDELTGAGFAFHTTSDTEVILAAHCHWGPVEAARRLSGMYAYLIWDAATDTLTIVRDRFGKKPVYAAKWRGGLAVASEIKSLLTLPDMGPTLDRTAVEHYLTYRYVPAPRTLFTGIEKLPPASVTQCRGDEIRTDIYWRPADRQVSATLPDMPADPVAGFAERLDEAVRLRMISDVPFGAFLSGGIDSSAIVALMSRHSDHPVKTFSVGFEEAEYSELKYARMIADQCKTDHTELTIRADGLMDHLPKLIRHRDAPVAEPSDIPIYLLSVEARKSVKMVLTGEGSDEILAGYPKHNAERYAARYHSLVPGFLHTSLIRPTVSALPYAFRRIKTLFQSLSEREIETRFPRWFGAMGPAERDQLLAAAASGPAPDQTPFDTETGNSPLRQLLHFDQTSWLPDNLLERGDRMTMAASLEARMPFMAHELANYVSACPESCRIQGGEDKWLLRQAMKPVLPREIIYRDKVGFRVPVNEWFRTTMRDWVMDHLTGPTSLTRDLYDGEVLKNLLDEHTSGRQNHEKLIWMLMGLELFQQEYRLGDG